MTNLELLRENEQLRAQLVSAIKDREKLVRDLLASDVENTGMRKEIASMKRTHDRYFSRRDTVMSRKQAIQELGLVDDLIVRTVRNITRNIWV